MRRTNNLKPATNTTNKGNNAKPVPKAQAKQPVDTPKVNFFLKMYNLLFHDDLYYRIGGFLIFGLLLFLIVWAVFMFLAKSPNLLADSFMVKKFFKAEVVKSFGPWDAKAFNAVWNIFGMQIKAGNFINVILLTLAFFLNHLVFVVIFIFGLSLFKIGRWNLSLIYFIFYTILWGIVSGTNSFSFPVGSDQVLGSLILFARFGLWTWFSYMLLLISSTQFAFYGTSTWTSWDWKQTRKFWPVSFTPEQREIFIYGLLFLLASSLAEANIFVHYSGVF